MPEESAAIENEEVGSTLLESEESTTQTEETSDDVKWWYDKDVPGTGEPPEFYVGSKYKTLADQAKAWQDLRQHVGGFAGAPEEYEIALNDDIKDKIEIDPEDEILQSFTEFAKSKNMTQEAYNDFINLMAYRMVKDEETEAQAEQEQLKGELEKLGPQAKELIGEIKTWGQTNIPDEFKNVFRALGKSAAGIQFLNYIKGKMVYNKIPQHSDSLSNTNRQEEAMKLKEMIGDKRYGSDMQYTQLVDQRYKEFYGG